MLIAVGAILLALGLWVWARRDRMTEEPRWLSSISRMTPVGAGVIGALLVLTNPKMLAANAAAGILIGTAGLGLAGAEAAVAYYSAVASSTVAVPVLAYVAVGARRRSPHATQGVAAPAQRPRHRRHPRPGRDHRGLHRNSWTLSPGSTVIGTTEGQQDGHRHDKLGNGVRSITGSDL